MAAIKAVIRLTVPAAKAAPSPKIGQALGSLGVNMMQFCKKFNAQTTEYNPGIPLRVTMTAFKDGTFTLSTRAPVTSWFIKEAAGVEKGASRPGHETAGSIHVKQIYEIGKIKLKDIDQEKIKNVTLEGICKTIVANCGSMGITIDGTPDRM
mmetsp:Transcript_2412/g.3460  ORF Transcript_2412/g.3460 Transcript_2412/m.3460 type:complete len:152 (+) Transcript_2412:26-481(+)